MSVEYIKKYGEMWTEINITGEKWLADRGVEFITLSPEEEDRCYNQGSKPLMDEYVKEMKSKGLPGEEVINFIAETAKSYKK